MKDWSHTLFSDGDLSDYLVDRWQEFSSERGSANFDASLSKYILRLPELDFSKRTVVKWGENEPEPADFASQVDYLKALLAFLRGKLVHLRSTFIILDIPFEGDANFFRFRPSGFTLPPPQGLLCEKSIQMRYERCGSEDAEWETLLMNDFSAIHTFLEAASVLADGFNQKVREFPPPP